MGEQRSSGRGTPVKATRRPRGTPRRLLVEAAQDLLRQLSERLGH